MAEIKIDISRQMGALFGVLMEPYTSFLTKLHAEGRITDDEYLEVYRAFEAQIPRLAELTQARLREKHGIDSTPSHRKED